MKLLSSDNADLSKYTMWGKFCIFTFNYGQGTNNISWHIYNRDRTAFWGSAWVDVSGKAISPLVRGGDETADLARHILLWYNTWGGTGISLLEYLNGINNSVS